jgi:hemerythrin
MAYLNWNRAFDTGVPGIDYEHHRLVDMLNEIDELILHDGEKREKRKIAGILAEFHTLATAHFALEEKIMRDQDYAGLGPDGTSIAACSTRCAR